MHETTKGNDMICVYKSSWSPELSSFPLSQESKAPSCKASTSSLALLSLLYWWHCHMLWVCNWANLSFAIYFSSGSSNQVFKSLESLSLMFLSLSPPPSQVFCFWKQCFHFLNKPPSQCFLLASSKWWPHPTKPSKCWRADTTLKLPKACANRRVASSLQLAAWMRWMRCRTTSLPGPVSESDKCGPLRKYHLYSV